MNCELRCYNAGYVTIDDNETNAVSFISNKKYIEKRYSPT